MQEKHTEGVMPVPATSSASYSLNFEERRGGEEQRRRTTRPLVKVELSCDGNVFKHQNGTTGNLSQPVNMVEKYTLLIIIMLNSFKSS